MTISRMQLEELANGSDIEFSKCEKNAYRVYEIFKNLGVTVYLGKADFYKEGKFHSTTEYHFWNVLKKKSSEGIDFVQIIDIYNYKSDSNNKYLNHSGSEQEIDNFIKHYIPNQPNA